MLFPAFFMPFFRRKQVEADFVWHDSCTLISRFEMKLFTNQIWRLDMKEENINLLQSDAEVEKQFVIEINGKSYETTEEVYKAYFSMEYHEQYLEKKSRNYNLSYEGLAEAGYLTEERLTNPPKSIIDTVVSTILIEKMLQGVDQLQADEKWLITELFFEGKSEREISRESGIPRKTLSYRKEVILLKLKKYLKN